ncbi:MAG: MBL fold metallo-hydrolase [Clostridia bacterium]|nr:MBL fold metallo-hydrolase [Clostridia bacterium]
MARKSKATKGISIVLSIIVFLIGAGYYLYTTYFNKLPPLELKGELSIHFLELGNKYAGDCIYIKAGDNDILVDAGSTNESVPTIKSYLDRVVLDNKLEYVIATHADQDHIAGFGCKNGIFDLYECETIIDFARSDKDSDTYNNYVAKRDAEVAQGATHYTVLECYNNLNGAKREIMLTESIRLTFLYQKFYENKSSEENNYSVCFLLTHGTRNFLFTGDLEEDGEESLLTRNNLPQVELFKAGHHGSNTSNTTKLLSVIQPKIVTVTCVAGSVEYTQNLENTFPTQNVINNIALYTEKVYVTSTIEVEYNEEKDKYENVGEYTKLNGNIVVTSSSTEQEVLVDCDGLSSVLKDTDWFKQNREVPLAWQ